MKQTTMCILSGFMGAMFVMACGVVDGNNMGGKSAYADEGVGLQIKSIEFDCEEAEYGNYSEDYLEFTDRAYRGEIIVSQWVDGCLPNYPNPDRAIFHYIE